MTGEQLQGIADELHESWLNGNHEVVTKAILALPKPAAIAVSAIIACKLYDSDGSRVRFMRRLMRGAECHQTSQS
jgi:hypothetical protein